MNSGFHIRLVTPDDAAAIQQIYTPFVLSTAITFEYEVPSIAEFENRINTILPDFPWLVCEFNGVIIGYAYGHKHRPRAAYQWSPETTVYIAEEFHKKGIARLLYETLFEIFKLQGFVNVYAGVVVPNTKSEKFHEHLGFTELGLFKQVGYKFNTWHDTRWYQLHFQLQPAHPPIPKSLQAVRDTAAFQQIMEEVNSRTVQIPY